MFGKEVLLAKTLIFVEYEYYYGRGNWDRELIKRLAKKGYLIHAITRKFPSDFQDQEQEIKNLGVRFHFIDTRNGFNFAIVALAEVLKLVRKNKAVLYIPSIRLAPFCYVFKKLFGAGLIFALQGAPLLELDIMPEFKRIRQNRVWYFLKRKLIGFEEKISALLADRVTVFSKMINNELVALDVPQKRIDLMYYCIDQHTFKKDQEKRMEIRSELNVSDQDILVTYVARLSFDVPSRLWAAEMLIEMAKELNLKVMLVGGGDALEYLRERIKTADLSDRVFVRGFVANKNVPDVLSASDVFFFVMKDPLPTYGLALLEAMSCETAVLTNNSGSAKEIIADGQNGYLVDPTPEAIRFKLKNIVEEKRDYFNDIGTCAREDVCQKYSWEVVEDKIEAIISSL